jgi:hypothetical protein
MSDVSFWINIVIAARATLPVTQLRPLAIRSVLLGATLLVACAQRSPERTEVSDAIARSVENGRGAKVDLGEAAPSPWTRVCIIPPYASWETVDHAIGFKWRGPQLDLHEVYDLLVFIDGDRAVAHVEHSRVRGDVSLDRVECLARAQARFEVKGAPHSDEWLVLVPVRDD